MDLVAGAMRGGMQVVHSEEPLVALNVLAGHGEHLVAVRLAAK